MHCIEVLTDQVDARWQDWHFFWLESLDFGRHDGFNDFHMLFGVVCCLAELQTALSGDIRTEKSLKTVLDRRPFI